MRLPKFKYFEPKTLKAAIKIFALSQGKSVLLAGGTDLLVNMKHRLNQPDQIINLKSIPRLAYITDTKEGLRVGPLATLQDIMSSRIVMEKYPGLCQAAREAGAYALQAMGTIAGNLCQGNRCKFYNQSAFWRSVRPPCCKAGGEICYVVRKGGQCHSAYCGDLAPVLIALDSRIKITGPDEERSIPLKRLYTGNGKRPLSLKRGEILKEIVIPASPGPSSSGKMLYLKWRVRDAIEFPMISLALYLERDEDKRIRNAKIVFSAAGSGPVEASETEKLLRGGYLEDALIERGSNEVIRELSPMRTSTASPAYRRKIAGTLLRRGLEEMKI